MSNTIDTTITMENEEFDFELIKADFQDLVNYINNNKENLNKDKLKELRDNLVQLETILNNVLGDKPKASKKTTKKTSTKKEVEKPTTFDDSEGKEYYDNLKVGDEFQYVMSNGTVVTARKIETKSKSGLTAACEVVSGLEIAEGKTKKRYPKFSKILKIQNTEKPVIKEAEKPVIKEAEKPVIKEAEKTEEAKQPIEQAKTVAQAEKSIEQEPVQMAASVETENDLFDDDFNFDFDIE